MEENIIEITVKVVDEIRYFEEKAWGLYAFEPVGIDDSELESFKRNKYGNYGMNGVMQRLKLNTEYKAKMVEENHPTYGWGYKIKSIYQDLPQGTKAQRSFFKALLTENQVDSIYKAYTEDDDIIQMMKDETFDYEKVHGFGEVTYPKIREKVLDYVELQDAIIKFEEYEIEPKLIMKLVKHFGSSGVFMQKLETNPYCLTEVSGIGFLKADAVAKSMGYDLESPHRINACLEYVIEESENSGDTYIKVNSLITDCAGKLKIKKPLIKEQLKVSDKVVIIDDKVALRKTYAAEQGVADWLTNHLTKSTELEFDVEAFIKKEEEKYGLTLSEQQKQFFHNIKKYGINFLVGYAGCGKSMLQKFVIDLLDELHLSFALLAPTGKASKVLSGYTKRQAYTIHKRVGIGQDNDTFNSVDLWEDYIIIDESSMCGITLIHILLTKLKNPNVRLLFIGDSFQIPSVDKGNFLFDCQESGVFPITMLDIVFRQSEGGVLDLVTKMRQGEKFIDDNFVGIKKFGEDCILVSAPQEKMEKGYAHYYERLVEKFGINNVLVLSPTKKAKLGTYQVNNNLQEIANPPSSSKSQVFTIKDKEEVCLREQDNVINTKNAYRMKDINDHEVDIMNGETGQIRSVDEEKRLLTIAFDDMIVVFPNNELGRLLLSYCITMHKSQGSASDAIIAISDKAHKHQLSANLLYTAWTRTRKFLVILCQADVVNYAMKKVANLRRNTFLCDILKGEVTYDIFADSKNQQSA